jgi:hypothetical protein
MQVRCPLTLRPERPRTVSEFLVVLDSTHVLERAKGQRRFLPMQFPYLMRKFQDPEQSSDLDTPTRT